MICMNTTICTILIYEITLAVVAATKDEMKETSGRNLIGGLVEGINFPVWRKTPLIDNNNNIAMVSLYPIY